MLNSAFIFYKPFIFWRRSCYEVNFKAQRDCNALSVLKEEIATCTRPARCDFNLDGSVSSIYLNSKVFVYVCSLQLFFLYRWQARNSSKTEFWLSTKLKSFKKPINI